MKKFLILFLAIIFISSCARTVEPTIENINTIFSSKDFTFEFIELGKSKKSISFRVDYLVYKSDQPTIRRNIEYDEVVLINDFIQNIVNNHQVGINKESTSHYVVKNTAYETVIIPKENSSDFNALLKKLKLIN